MNTPTVPQTPADEKPEPPSIVAMLQRVQDAIAERDRLAADRLVTMFRSCEGRK